MINFNLLSGFSAPQSLNADVERAKTITERLSFVEFCKRYKINSISLKSKDSFNEMNATGKSYFFDTTHIGRVRIWQNAVETMKEFLNGNNSAAKKLTAVNALLPNGQRDWCISIETATVENTRTFSFADFTDDDDATSEVVETLDAE
jgi:hypothetical protein